MGKSIENDIGKMLDKVVGGERLSPGILNLYSTLAI